LPGRKIVVDQISQTQMILSHSTQSQVLAHYSIKQQTESLMFQNRS
jgi:hypothetical protein